MGETSTTLSLSSSPSHLKTQQRGKPQKGVAQGAASAGSLTFDLPAPKSPKSPEGEIFDC